MERKTIILIVSVGMIAVFVLVLLFFRFSAGEDVQRVQILGSGQNSSIEELNIRMDQVEKAMAKLIQQVGSQNQSGGNTSDNSASSSLEARINNIESTLASLNVTVNQLKSGTSQTTSTTGQSTSTTNRSPLYIPLGWVASSSNMTWTSITSQTFTFNPADYPGMTSVQFSVSMLVFQGNGTAYAQLYNSTDNNAVFGSSVSTTSQNYVTVTSSKFQVPTTQKTYVLQLMASTGYAATVQGAWLKINFD